MLKEILKDSIIKELKLIKRLSTKVPTDSLDFRPKENARSIIELLQYLSGAGTGMLLFWQSNETEARPFLMKLRENAPLVTLENAAAIFDAQIELVNEIFASISEEDLATKVVSYPWGATDTLGKAILETSVKWLTGYKMQLFLYIKQASDLALSTPDLWRKTED